MTLLYITHGHGTASNENMFVLHKQNKNNLDHWRKAHPL